MPSRYLKIFKEIPRKGFKRCNKLGENISFVSFFSKRDSRRSGRSPGELRKLSLGVMWSGWGVQQIGHVDHCTGSCVFECAQNFGRIPSMLHTCPCFMTVEGKGGKLRRSRKRWLTHTPCFTQRKNWNGNWNDWRVAPWGCSCARSGPRLAHWQCLNQTSEPEGRVWGHWTQVE